MLGFEDERWAGLMGGHRMPFDPRSWLARIESNDNAAGAWDALWEELHHQGDVGDASYAAVPHIARIFLLNTTPRQRRFPSSSEEGSQEKLPS
jgi:hypothetical protein